MNDSPSRDEITAHLEAAEARTDAKLAQLVGEVRAGFASIEGKIGEIRAGLASAEGRSDARLAALESKFDSRFAALDSKFEARFATLDGKIAALAARVDSVERATSGTKATVVVTGLAAVAVVIATLAYGQTWFGIGVTTRDVVKATVSEYLLQAKAAPK